MVKKIGLLHRKSVVAAAGGTLFTDTLALAAPVFVLLIILGLAVTAKLIGTEEILGGFLAGLCLNKVLRERENLSEHVHFSGRLLFIPFFFVSTGMSGPLLAKWAGKRMAESDRATA